MPPQRGASGMARRVATIARERGHVDAAHKRDAIVDHDRLLVVAMKGPLPAIESALHNPGRPKLVTDTPHQPPRRRKHRQRRARPQKHTNLDPRRRPNQQITHHHRRIARHQHEPRRDKPSSQMHMGRRRADLLHHPRQRELTVNQHLQLVPMPRRRSIIRPPARRRPQHHTANPLQPPRMMPTNSPRDTLARHSIDPRNRIIDSHTHHPTANQTATSTTIGLPQR